MYAILETGGKQYTVKAGDVIYVEKLGADDDSAYTFDKVLAIGEEGSLNFGAPYIPGAKVMGKIIKTGKAKKIHILTYRAKKDSKRKIGHRQPFTKVEITEVSK